MRVLSFLRKYEVDSFDLVSRVHLKMSFMIDLMNVLLVILSLEYISII